MNDKVELARLLARKKAIFLARDDLIEFARYMMPIPDAQDDVSLSLYRPAKHHRVMGAALEKVEKSEFSRLQITLPPRHGKTKLASHLFAAWFAGRNPEKSIIVATYSEKFAWDHGRAVRDIIENPLFGHVFPGVRLKPGSASMDRLETEAGGVLFFLGRGSGATGRGADVILLDDPTKDRKEADSPTIREQLWSWYTQVLQTRLMTKAGRIVIIQCMTGDTPVLMANGTEKPLRDIRRGNAVATCDDKGQLSASFVRNWASNGLDRVFTIRMISGITVKANAKHPFLVCGDGASKWTKTRDLRPGQEIFRVNGGNGKVKLARGLDVKPLSKFEGIAPHTTTKSDGRMGFGHLLSTLSHAATHILNIVTGSLSKNITTYSSSRTASAPSAGSLPGIMFAPIGAENSASIIATTRTQYEGCSATTAILPLATRRTQTPRNLWLTTSDFILDTVAEVTPAGVEEVFDVQIEETENFIANGLVSHNTRWHEDDLIGRLTDPTNPCFSESEAKKWRVIDMPAIARDNDVLGRKNGEALWPERFDREYLDNIRETDIRGFQALYQGRPTPEEGSFFKAVQMRTYARMSDQPPKERLRFYAASDHAVSLEQGRDKTCLMVIGVDEHDQIWVQPDLFWQQADTQLVVETMTILMERYKPLFWWAEKGHISKSIGPFLRKRMLEKRVFCSLDELTPVGDKQTRAQSVQGRMAMLKILFPGFTRWWPEAHDQMLKFPQGAHDDFVDTLSLFGIGLYKQRAQRLPPKPKDNEKFGTYGWVIEDAKRERKRERESLTTGGW